MLISENIESDINFMRITNRNCLPRIIYTLNTERIYSNIIITSEYKYEKSE